MCLPKLHISINCMKRNRHHLLIALQILWSTSLSFIVTIASSPPPPPPQNTHTSLFFSLPLSLSLWFVRLSVSVFLCFCLFHSLPLYVSLIVSLSLYLQPDLSTKLVRIATQISVMRKRLLKIVLISSDIKKTGIWVNSEVRKQKCFPRLSYDRSLLRNFVSFLVASLPSNMALYVRDGPEKTALRALSLGLRLVI